MTAAGEAAQHEILEALLTRFGSSAGGLSIARGQSLSLVSQHKKNLYLSAGPDAFFQHGEQPDNGSIIQPICTGKGFITQDQAMNCRTLCIRKRLDTLGPIEKFFVVHELPTTKRSACLQLLGIV